VLTFSAVASHPSGGASTRARHVVARSVISTVASMLAAHAVVASRTACMTTHHNDIHVSNKKLCCRKEAARCFVSANILLSHSRSLKIIRNDTAVYGVCKSLIVFH